MSWKYILLKSNADGSSNRVEMRVRAILTTNRSKSYKFVYFRIYIEPCASIHNERKKEQTMKDEKKINKKKPTHKYCRHPVPSMWICHFQLEFFLVIRTAIE